MQSDYILIGIQLYETRIFSFPSFEHTDYVIRNRYRLIIQGYRKVVEI